MYPGAFYFRVRLKCQPCPRPNFSWHFRPLFAFVSRSSRFANITETRRKLIDRNNCFNAFKWTWHFYSLGSVLNVLSLSSSRINPTRYNPSVHSKISISPFRLKFIGHDHVHMILASRARMIIWTMWHMTINRNIISNIYWYYFSAGNPSHRPSLKLTI